MCKAEHNVRHIVSSICHWTIHEILENRESWVKICPLPGMFRKTDSVSFPPCVCHIKFSHRGGGRRGDGRPQQSRCDGDQPWCHGVGLGVCKGGGPVTSHSSLTAWQTYFINKRGDRSRIFLTWHAVSRWGSGWFSKGTYLLLCTSIPFPIYYLWNYLLEK